MVQHCNRQRRCLATGCCSGRAHLSWFWCKFAFISGKYTIKNFLGHLIINIHIGMIAGCMDKPWTIKRQFCAGNRKINWEIWSTPCIMHIWLTPNIIWFTQCLISVGRKSHSTYRMVPIHFSYLNVFFSCIGVAYTTLQIVRMV